MPALGRGGRLVVSEGKGSLEARAHRPFQIKASHVGVIGTGGRGCEKARGSEEARGGGRVRS